MNNTTQKFIATPLGMVFSEFTDNQQEKNLVLLHGNSSSHRFWSPLLQGKLKTYYNFLTFDLPGHGQSPAAEDAALTYSLPSYVEILKDVLKSYNLKHYYIFGHSLGGHVVLEALEHLDNCMGAMIMGTPPFCMPPRIDLAFRMSPQFINFMQSGSDRAIMEATFISMLPPDKASLASLLIEDYFDTDPQSRLMLAQNIMAGMVQDEIACLRSAQIPVFLLISEDDQMVNPAYFTELLSDQKIFWLENTGHYAPLEQPDIVADILVEKFEGQLA
jgi:pimeloyl-ACP methyl ester carboxylesterase